MTPSSYCGRIAPSPTGFLHLGHAATFWVAQERARAAGGRLILRVEDIDAGRCKAEYRDALLEDLRWAGFEWDAVYAQSERLSFYREILERLRASGAVYPCRCSRREIAQSASAPHGEDEEPIYPGFCRPKAGDAAALAQTELADAHWRFRVPDGERLSYTDGAMGEQSAVAGVDFGDFVVWRRDGVPAYQLAVVADDAAMGITEVVRGADLALSTFRQLLLYRALGWTPPKFFHTPLLLDPETGQRLAKRHAALSLRQLRRECRTPEEVRARVSRSKFH